VYRLRLLVLPLLIWVSIPLVAQARRLPGNICFPPEEVHYLLSENPFHRPVLLQQLPLQGEINLAQVKLKDIVAPPEFRARSQVTMVDASGVSLFPVSHYPLFWCTWSLQQKSVRY
jgi:hypothetical protein